MMGSVTYDPPADSQRVLVLPPISQLEETPSELDHILHQLDVAEAENTAAQNARQNVNEADQHVAAASSGSGVAGPCGPAPSGTSTASADVPPSTKAAPQQKGAGKQSPGVSPDASSVPKAKARAKSQERSHQAKW